jgi:hypothetical protein
VPFVQTSAANVPKVVRLRVPEAHTFPGIEAIELATDAIEPEIDVSVVPRDDDAVNTVAFVFAFTTAASELVAVRSAASV